MGTRILRQADVRTLLTAELALAAVEDALRQHGRGDTLMPPKVYLQLDHHGGDFRAMPAYFAGSVGVKWVCSYPENPQRNGLPAVMAVYILNDPATAATLAVMDATLITAVRTGAAAAIASRQLLGRDPASLGIIGCGAQSRHIVEAHRLLWPDVQIRCSDVARRAAERLAGDVSGEAVSIEEAAACDIVCTATPSRHPVVRREWIREGAHINAMGADAPGKQELDPQILLDARVFLDDMHQAVESGEVNVPIAKGLYDQSRIYGTLGEILAGRVDARGNAAITVFDSTGLAVQDAAVARAVFESAREQNIGLEVDLL
jgi:alanine dehydrogenase